MVNARALWLIGSSILCWPALVNADRITSFPLEARPEGITNGLGSTLYVSEILSGRVISVDAMTGDTKQVVPAQANDRQAWGLWMYNSNDTNALFVAGGGPSFGGGTVQVHVYDVGNMGAPIVSCEPVLRNSLGAFLNDVTVLGNTAYITDSVHGKLMAMNADLAIKGNCTVWEVDLPANFDPVENDDFGANGVVPYGDGLLVCHEIDGSVWFVSSLEPGVDGSVSPSFQEVIPDGGAPGADGLTVMGDRLYVTQNFENKIGVYELNNVNDGSGSSVNATLLGHLVSPAFATPATSAIYDGYIYSTNSRFVPLPEIEADADDNVVAVALDALSPTSGSPPTSVVAVFVIMLLAMHDK